MALTFGEPLTDISADETELAEFLELARSRESAAGDNVVNGQGEDSDEGYDFEADPDPGFGRESFGETLFGGDSDNIAGPKAPRVTVKIRKDIQAKTALFLSMGGTVWERRDQVCGGTFVESVPDVSEALTDIFCDSPDIVRWFTAAGGFMKWLTLAQALQPVMASIVGHHITHSIADGEPVEQDWSAYATGR
jgi:hypothetical protein